MHMCHAPGRILVWPRARRPELSMRWRHPRTMDPLPTILQIAAVQLPIALQGGDRDHEAKRGSGVGIGDMFDATS